MDAVVWTGTSLEHTQDVRVRSPGPGEVTVRIDAAGLCHSDVNALDGLIDQPVPVVLGHEACGVVIDRGPGVKVHIGQKVVLSTLRSCGACRACQAGAPTCCRDGQPAADPVFTRRGEPVEQFVRVGAFARQTVVHERQVVAVPTSVPDIVCALLGCAVLTGFGAVWSRAAVREGDAVLVVGAGGIGLAAVHAAALAGASRVLVVDRNPRKQALAHKLGATDFQLVDTAADVVEAARGLEPRGFDATFECVGRPDLLKAAIDVLAWGGRAVIVGLPAASTPLTFGMRDLFHDKALLGCRMGSVDPHEFVPKLAERYLAGELLLDPLVTAVAPLRQIGELIDDLRSGRLDRGVVDLTGGTRTLSRRDAA
ncbi:MULTISPECIES: zinc-binding dehydrogenase [Streptomyces]|uniref:Zinc-binding dehydrogenase n=1 Tax=Streptomyces doudnae TaxID=3075536 RepID=A0ABD5EVA3_9ACTN|nr:MULTISPECIES: zinc-binding dehydrogenase [unclassified Streptomyces]MDT0438641.1 zinc-binding dehydrogenase [Streptomyces sp. DSM 41981]MYQ69067.1 alcohol dehydrogenase catalytic domain-containing protein [Streptomyces sp. SID4950]SCE51129.1 S-(hydroxymethyl)glutathione dehydrogenase / alcohol dehydrogenase [Streptomyces sp. SolWspMP-5a-2]